MGLLFYYRATDGTLVGPMSASGDFTVRQPGSFEVMLNAEEGSTGQSRLVVDDPGGTIEIPGLRYFAVKETAVSSSSNQYIFAGYTTDRRYSRGGNGSSFITGSSRQIEVGLVDANHILESRIMVGAESNRPAETDIQRITWLLTKPHAALITDTRFFSSADPEDMDANDYRGQSVKQIIDDCAQQSGKNYYLTYFGDTATANQPWGTWSLWYGNAANTSYTSGVSLSNNLSDVNNSTVFGISHDETVLTRDPSRIVSGAYLPYDGGAAYVQSQTTFNTFEKRDLTFPAENVKTATKANRRGNRYLADLDEEDDVITTSFQVPAAQVNEVREGMRLLFKATHLPGYEDYSYLRVLNRTVTQDSELTYRIKVELSPTGVEPSRVGTIIGGQLCTETGYHVPVDAGDFGPMKSNNCTYSWSNSPAGDNTQPLNYGRCLLYAGATYAYQYDIQHGSSNCGASMRITSIGGGTIYANEHMGCVCPCCVEPFRTSATGSWTITPSVPPAQSAYYELLVQHTSYAGCSASGVIGTCSLTYVSGPDPRFSGLVGCPI